MKCAAIPRARRSNHGPSLQVRVCWCVGVGWGVQGCGAACARGGDEGIALTHTRRCHRPRECRQRHWSATPGSPPCWSRTTRLHCEPGPRPHRADSGMSSTLWRQWAFQGRSRGRPQRRRDLLGMGAGRRARGSLELPCIAPCVHAGMAHHVLRGRGGPPRTLVGEPLHVNNLSRIAVSRGGNVLPEVVHGGGARAILCVRCQLKVQRGLGCGRALAEGGGVRVAGR